MTTVKSSIFRFLVSLVVFTGAVVVCADPPNAAGYPHGSYSVTVAGDWTGSGHAAVGAHSVNLDMTIMDANGNSGTLHIPHMVVDNQNHFLGTGTVMGLSVNVSGRLEPCPPGPNGQANGWRIFAHVQTTDNQSFGVIFGYK